VAASRPRGRESGRPHSTGNTERALPRRAWEAHARAPAGLWLKRGVPARLLWPIARWYHPPTPRPRLSGYVLGAEMPCSGPGCCRHPKYIKHRLQ
jgi:hypothetical protein